MTTHRIESLRLHSRLMRGHGLASKCRGLKSSMADQLPTAPEKKEEDGR